MTSPIKPPKGATHTERPPSTPPISTPPPSMRLRDVVRELPGASVVMPSAEAWDRLPVTGVHHDSRAVERGDLFVAREGGRVNGLAFVDEAVKRGAAAIIARRGAVQSVSVPVIEVEDVPLALALSSAAVYGHPTFGVDVIGITGTNGKTTTTVLTRAMLEHTGARCGLVGTLGSDFEGVSTPSPHTSPEADELARTIRSMRDRGATHVAMEVSSIALSAKRADAVRFRVAAFTNLTQDHLDYHGTMDAYADAKARLFKELAPSASVLNVRDPFGRRLAAELGKHAVTKYSAATDVGDPDVYPIDLELDARGLRMTVRTPLGNARIESELVGAHNVENCLCAISIGVALGLDPQEMADGLSGDVRVPGRLERCDDPRSDDVVVLVDYAHTPDALDRVLSGVRSLTDKPAGRVEGPKGRADGVRTSRVLCVFGCGGDRDQKKRPLMGAAAGEHADVVFVTNDNPRSEDPRAIVDEILPGLAASRAERHVELDRRVAIRRAVLAANPGDVVVIAGKGHETYQIIGGQTFSFDDREVAREALSVRREARREEESR